MILLNLFITFFKIGILNFGGGNGITATIHKEIIERKEWITQEEFINIITISRITPGPIATNIATYVGAKIAGITGAIIATMALISAPILIIIFIISTIHKINFLKYYLEQLKPVIIKSFALAGLNLLILLFYKNVSPAILIISSGVLYIFM
ncbi:chromate transporter [Borrelia duttonii]|uniref:chromate transporter n=1 Tax=Borrelia duttonii TaxID=40834 RepID=UPI0004B43173|nr:chromate transporter [Borrelia duttonii]